MPLLTLKDFMEQAADADDVGLKLRTPGAVPPPLLQMLRRLERLDLLRDEVVFGLLAQAPIDPIGLYGAMKAMGVWAFNVLDCTMTQVLAKKGNEPVALMRLDLLSDDLVFVISKGGQLVEHKTVTAEETTTRMQEPGMTATSMMAWFTDHIRETVNASSKEKS
jgi:hypothetical protein